MIATWTVASANTFIQRTAVDAFQITYTRYRWHCKVQQPSVH